jgi:hypothetical protein
MKTLSPSVALILAIITTAASFSFEPVSIFFRAIPPTAKQRTICKAKLEKITSNYDLEAILSSEKELAAGEDETTLGKIGRRRNSNNDRNKKMLKQQMKQQMKKKQRTQHYSVTNDNADINDGFDDGSSDDETGFDYASLLKDVNFSAYEVPPHLGGKRIDAVLVELLNKNSEGSDSQASNPLSISRSQCGTLLSNECVSVVQPEDANEFINAWKAEEETTTVPHRLIGQHSAPIQRKSHILEPSSILIYPSRDSLLSTSSSSSSALLSNLIPPTEIIPQKIPLNILYEDEHMVVINKQAGMVV